MRPRPTSSSASRTIGTRGFARRRSYVRIGVADADGGPSVPFDARRDDRAGDVAERPGDPVVDLPISPPPATTSTAISSRPRAAAAEGLGSDRGAGVAESSPLAALRRADRGAAFDEGRLEELVPELEDVVRDQPDVAGWRAVLVSALAASGDASPDGTQFDRLAADGFAAMPRDFSWTAAMVVLTSGIAAVGRRRPGRGARVRRARSVRRPHELVGELHLRAGRPGAR